MANLSGGVAAQEPPLDAALLALGLVPSEKPVKPVNNKATPLRCVCVHVHQCKISF